MRLKFISLLSMLMAMTNLYAGGEAISLKLIQVKKISDSSEKYNIIFQINKNYKDNKGISFESQFKECNKLELNIHYHTKYFYMNKLKYQNQNKFPSHAAVVESIESLNKLVGENVWLADLGDPYVIDGSCRLSTRAVILEGNILIPMMRSF